MSRGKREYVVSFRVTEAEWGQLNTRAAEEGMQRADYCRSVCLTPGVVERLYVLTRGLAEALLDPDAFEQIRAQAEDEEEVEKAV